MSPVLVKINDCRDSLLWYAKHIGEAFVLLRDLPGENCWLVRASDGYSNIVHKKDGSLVEE